MLVLSGYLLLFKLIYIYENTTTTTAAYEADCEEKNIHYAS
jgi:hypothetical protein